MPFQRRGFYRRKLPHLQRDAKPHFITFCTHQRWILPESARTLVLRSCLHDHGTKYNLRVAVVMPDHVNLILTPQVNGQKNEIYSLAAIMDAIKGASAHKINHALRRKGPVWQAESFDHVIRSSTNLDAKIAYIRENPLRWGLVNDLAQYPWLWEQPFQNPYAPAAELRSAGQPRAAVPT